MKTIRHRWIKQDGFRKHQCEKCHCIRKWDAGFQRIMYFWANKITYDAPSCIIMNGVPYDRIVNHSLKITP